MRLKDFLKDYVSLNQNIEIYDDAGLFYTGSAQHLLANDSGRSYKSGLYMWVEHVESIDSDTLGITVSY